MYANLLPNVRNERTTVFNRHTEESATLSRKDNTPSILFALALHNAKRRHVLEMKVNYV